MQFFFFTGQDWEEIILKRKIKRDDVVKRLSEIAFGKANDIVKLAYLNVEEQMDILDQLDLTMLSEIKRGAGGGIEVKLLNRMEALKLLMEEEVPERRKDTSAEAFFAAINAAAMQWEKG